LAVDTAAPETNPDSASLSADCDFSRDTRSHVGKDIDAAIFVGLGIDSSIDIASAAAEYVVVEAYDGGAEISSAITAPAAIAEVQNVRRHTASAEAPGKSSSSKSNSMIQNLAQRSKKTGLF
jgi:hypothetical protein